jgi:hypothetical protein
MMRFGKLLRRVRPRLLSSIRGYRSAVVCRAGAVGVVAASVFLVAQVPVVAAGRPGLGAGRAALPYARGALTGAQLRQDYLSDIKTATSGLKTVSAKLANLPSSASAARVQTAAAPLLKSLAPVEALLHETVGATTLEALGKPTLTGAGGATCNRYGTPSSGAYLVVAGKQYGHGFQMYVPGSCIEHWAAYRWHTGKKFSSLTGKIAYDESNGNCSGVDLEFLGNGGEVLPMRTNGGGVVESMVIEPGLASFSVEIGKQSNVTLKLGYTPAGCSNGSPTSVVDVVNDAIL